MFSLKITARFNAESVDDVARIIGKVRTIPECRSMTTEYDPQEILGEERRAGVLDAVSRIPGAS